MCQVLRSACLCICVFVCVFVYLCAYLRNNTNFTEFSLRASYGRISVLLRRRCVMLCSTVCTSVLWMASCLHVMAKHSRRGKGVCAKWLNSGKHRGPSLISMIILFRILAVSSVCHYKTMHPRACSRSWDASVCRPNV